MVKRDKPKLLLKLGTATLTKSGDKISRGKLEDIAQQVNQLRADYDVILVCSGAIAAAKQFIKLEKVPNGDIEEKQALAAIGQPFLMKLLYESFRDYDIQVGQCLLSAQDFENTDSRKNIQNTISVLLSNEFLPVINENDTTATEEIKFGDNDKLSALVAGLLQVDLLIIASNTNGLYDHEGNTIPKVQQINEVRQYVQNKKSMQGTGGMNTKLDAAELAQTYGIETWIINGHPDSFILDALSGKNERTRFLI